MKNSNNGNSMKTKMGCLRNSKQEDEQLDENDELQLDEQEELNELEELEHDDEQLEEKLDELEQELELELEELVSVKCTQSMCIVCPADPLERWSILIDS